MAANDKRHKKSPNIIKAQATTDQDINYQVAEANALFLSIGEGAIATDAEGKISRVNQTALDILGFTKPELLGKWYPGVVLAEDGSGNLLTPLERPITEVFMTGKSVFRKMYFRRKNGSPVAVAVTVSPILLNKKPIGAIEVFRDISEEVKLAKAKDDFIFLASHQLRTPATGVKQYLNLVMDGYAGKINSEQLKYLKTADSSNNRQLKIIDDLLNIATVDAGNFVLRKKKTDLVSLMQSVIDEQSSNFGAKRQKLIFNYSEPKVEASIDRDAFRMVLENLINNAYKYSYTDKEIIVTLENGKAEILITIKDNGVGIDRADIPKLFKKFSRIDNPLSISSGGTGLGLYWTKQIVDLHGGNIKVTSSKKSGSKFVIKLPL